MTAESALKFGPEWLRVLSQGNGTNVINNSLSPPPSSPEIPKYKLAEYRYGREEMLALFSKDIKMPKELKQFNGLAKDVCQSPMALIEFTEEEQKLWSRSVNSEAVLRHNVRGSTSGVTGPPAQRGGRGGSSVDRGRGRGRSTFYQRGLSSEDLDLSSPVGLTRQRSYERTTTDRTPIWDEGFRDRKYDKPFSVRDDDNGPPLRKDGSSSNLDWRTGNLRSNTNREEEENGRRLGTSRNEKWGRTNWRSDRDERHLETSPEWSTRTSYRKAGNHPRLRDQDFNEADALPEWSVEDNKDAEKVGTFDSSGAFLETKEDREEADRVMKEHPEDVDSSLTSRKVSELNVCSEPQENNSEIPANTSTPNSLSSDKIVEINDSQLAIDESTKKEEFIKNESILPPEMPTQSILSNKIEKDLSLDSKLLTGVSTVIEKREDLNFEHLEKAAENLVDTIEDDEKVEVHEAGNLSNAWYYRDPQGVIQGPFNDFEMAEWYKTGYFDLGLMVRQGCKGRFCTLGDLVSLRNCVPFMTAPHLNGDPTAIPRPSIPTTEPIRGLLGGLPNPSPLPVPHHFDVVNDQEHHLRMLQQQVLHQRLLQQQQYQHQQQQRFARQPVQPVLTGGNIVDNLAALNSNPQQYFLMQKLLAAQQQQQHQQPPRGLTRTPTTENGNVMDPVRQLAAQLAISQPQLSLKEDSPSMWNLPNTPRVAPNIGVGWSPKSVWDMENVNNHEKVIAASLMQTEQQLLAEEQAKKRLVEEELLLRNQREEEERRRRLQEEQERLRIEEELRRREQEEEELRKKEEILKKKQLEMEERKRKEYEERCREEEERRLREEQIRKQEEEQLRKQQEFFIHQQKEQQRLEELKRKEKRRQLEEEEKIKNEHQRELEFKLRQAEALKILHEKQKAKQGPAWGGSILAPENALSLVEIQRLQEEKEHQEKTNRELQQKLLIQHQMQVNAQQARSLNSSTWGENKSNVPILSIAEIQEAEKLALQKEIQIKHKQQQQQQQNNNITLSAASAWSNSSSNIKQMNNSASSLYSWNADGNLHNTTNGTTYFWEGNMTNTNNSLGQSLPSSSKKPETHTTFNGQSGKVKINRAKKEEETVMKLFETPKLITDEFTEWCIKALTELKATIDVDTFVTFLKDVESPYEVHDYVRQYLGEGKEIHNFTKQFLDKRSMYRNQARQKQATEIEEGMWGPARAINPSQNKSQIKEDDGFKTSASKKKKKNKMQKVDSTYLGFTVHAAMDRINIGDIDHVEDM